MGLSEEGEWLGYWDLGLPKEGVRDALGWPP